MKYSRRDSCLLMPYIESPVLKGADLVAALREAGYKHDQSYFDKYEKHSVDLSKYSIVLVGDLMFHGDKQQDPYNGDLRRASGNKIEIMRSHFTVLRPVPEYKWWRCLHTKKDGDAFCSDRECAKCE